LLFFLIKILCSFVFSSEKLLESYFIFKIFIIVKNHLKALPMEPVEPLVLCRAGVLSLLAHSWSQAK
jgi:hypothetical protein